MWYTVKSFYNEKNYIRALYKIIQIELIYRFLFYLSLLKRKINTQKILFENNLKIKLMNKSMNLNATVLLSLKIP